MASASARFAQYPVRRILASGFVEPFSGLLAEVCVIFVQLFADRHRDQR